MVAYVFKLYPENFFSSFVVIHSWDLLFIVKVVYF